MSRKIFEVLELDFALAYSMIGTGEIKDGKTIMLLQHAKINGLINTEQGRTLE